MENIRRSIKLFFVYYGRLLFQIIGIIAIIIFALHGINNIYKKENEAKIAENSLSQEEINEKQELLKKENEDKKLISEFLDYCNNGQIEEAYTMLSQNCIQEKYQTIDKFKTQYVDKIFIYKKEYKIKKEANGYKISIIEGMLETGKIENRESIVNYYKIENEALGKKIYIER